MDNTDSSCSTYFDDIYTFKIFIDERRQRESLKRSKKYGLRRTGGIEFVLIF